MHRRSLHPMKWTEGQVLHRWTRHEYKRLIDHGQCGDGETSQLVARGDPSLSPFALINVPGVGDVLGRY